MKVYTSYFANLKKLQGAGVVAISISRYSPKWFSGPEMKQLAPTAQMLKGTDEQYDIGMKNILLNLDAEEVQTQLQSISAMHNGADVAICCYERPGDYCHRHDVAKWMNEKLGTDIKEFGIAPAATGLKKSLFDALTDD